MKISQLLLPLTTWISGAFMAGFLVAGFVIVQFSRELPDAESIKSIELKVPLRVYSADNLLISEFGDERRKPITFEEAPQALIDSILASEDDGFFEHIGIDFKGIFRSAISNFKSGSSGQGASTITMQVARGFFLTPEKTYTRKLKEVLLALRLERILSKEEILSLYLNKIFLGHRSYGFGAAAEVYYGKELNQLSRAQIAMLAGLPKAPSTSNPLRNPEKAVTRRNYVLSRLNELSKISTSDYKIAVSEPVTAQKHSRKADLVAPYIAEMVRSQLTEQYGEGAYWQGLNVYTTILSKQQLAAQASLRKGLQAYDRRHGFRGRVGSIDLASINQTTETENLDGAYEDALRPYPNSQEQIPAIVLNVSENESKLWTRSFGEVQIELATSKWARRHKTANLVGDSPKAMSELLAIGDIVYLQPQEKKADDTNSKKPIESRVASKVETKEEQIVGWKLSQIPNVSGALISIQPSSGKILSLIGGYDFFLNKYNRATQSIRQPGSNIKPFIYAASLDKGFTPASLINGSSIVITDPAHGTLWRPENYSGKFFGPTRMREALSKSMNLVSIRLLRAIGIPYAREYVERFGIDINRFSASLTMALGSGGVKPLEMIGAYSALANGGYKVEPYFIEKITDRDGNIVYLAPQPNMCDECFAEYLPKPEPKPKPEIDDLIDYEVTPPEEPIADDDTIDQQNIEPDTGAEDTTIARTYEAPRIMSHANNFLTVNMMKDVVRRGTARKALALNRQDLAGKTGTTNDYIDAWFSGFNSSVVTTVWVGFDDPRSMGRGEAGSATALPIWVDYMKTGLDGIAEDNSELPDYIEAGFVNRNTGKRTDEFDPDATPEVFTIEELTPEYALLQNLSNDSTALDPFGGDNGIHQIQDQINDYIEAGIEGVLNNGLGRPAVELDQNSRIIEDAEDTEGLF